MQDREMVVAGKLWTSESGHVAGSGSAGEFDHEPTRACHEFDLPEETSMKRKRFGIAAVRFALVFSILLTVAVSRARADIPIASDSYATGSDPTMGQYVAGASLFSGQPANLTTPGFANGGYTHGLGFTSNFASSASGLINAADGADASTGSVQWIGVNDTTNRSVARNLSTFNEGTTGTIWISQLMMNSSTSNPTTTGGFVLSGFANTTFPAFGTTTGNLFGMYFGFSDSSGTANEADLVIRARGTAGGATSTDTVLVNGANNATAGNTYLVVAAVNINSNGSLDHVSYWVNPTDLSSQTALTNTALTSGGFDTLAFQGAAVGNGDFTRLNYAEQGWAGDAFFDEARLGTTLASIGPVPEPTSMVLLGVGSLAALVVRSRRRTLRAA
jgi:PEP-CTERM motif